MGTMSLAGAFTRMLRILTNYFDLCNCKAACTGNKNVGQKNEASFFCPTFLLAIAYAG